MWPCKLYQPTISLHSLNTSLLMLLIRAELGRVQQGSVELSRAQQGSVELSAEQLGLPQRC